MPKKVNNCVTMEARGTWKIVHLEDRGLRGSIEEHRLMVAPSGELTPQEVENFLGISDIHPVKFDGKVLICMVGERPSVHAWA